MAPSRVCISFQSQKVRETFSVIEELLARGLVFREWWARVEGAAWSLHSICLKTVNEVAQLHAGGWMTWRASIKGRECLGFSI